MRDSWLKAGSWVCLTLSVLGIGMIAFKASRSVPDSADHTSAHAADTRSAPYQPNVAAPKDDSATIRRDIETSLVDEWRRSGYAASTRSRHRSIAVVRDDEKDCNREFDAASQRRVAETERLLGVSKEK